MISLKKGEGYFSVKEITVFKMLDPKMILQLWEHVSEKEKII